MYIVSIRSNFTSLNLFLVPSSNVLNFTLDTRHSNTQITCQEHFLISVKMSAIRVHDKCLRDSFVSSGSTNLKALRAPPPVNSSIDDEFNHVHVRIYQPTEKSLVDFLFGMFSNQFCC